MILEVKGLCKVFQNGRRAVRAVDGVDLTLDAGDFVHLIGRSGGGKTTLLNLIVGLLEPTAGSISLCGTPYAGLTADQMAGLRNRRIGLVPQHAAMLRNLTVLENVVLPWYLSDRAPDPGADPYGRGRYLLEQLDIRALETAFPRELSGGELRRVSIARALMNEPVLLIADEPTADLDADSTAAVMQLLQRINDQGVTLLVVTHELETLSYGKRVYTMSAGKLAPGRPPAVDAARPVFDVSRAADTVDVSRAAEAVDVSRAAEAAR